MFINSNSAAQPLTELKFDVANIDPENVNCKTTVAVIDECGLQQGNSYRFHEFAYPTNQSSLISSCKRSNEALKCLRAYAKCLPPLSKQVLNAMVMSRQRYNKKVCTEKPSDAALKFIELGKCMAENKAASDKGYMAEVNSITTPEAIVNSKIEPVQQRLKQSCCSVAKVRKEYMDATMPHCKQYSHTASEVIDSYLADTVGIVCPDFEKKKEECDKLPKLTTSKNPQHRFFVRPILDVIQTLA